MGIFVPVLGKIFSSSIQMAEQLMTGKMPAISKLSFSVVDVRDVADIHIKARTNHEAKGQRFLATSDGTTSLPEIAEILRSQKYDTQQKVDIMNQFNGQQPGNTEKLAKMVMDTDEEEHPPLHLIMGPDAYERVTEYYQSQLLELEKWKEISFSTNFE